MKLFVIVLCLLSERFLIHRLSLKRVVWTQAFLDWFDKAVKDIGFFKNDYLFTLVFAFIPAVIVMLLLFFAGSWLAGLTGLIIQLLLVYYCFGPENAFYPKRTDNKGLTEHLVAVNSQVIAVIFWYYVAGPSAVVAYRLISFVASAYSQDESKKQAAERMMSVLDWIPARITAILYLLAGNFQAGLSSGKAEFFAGPASNALLLKNTGSAAASVTDDETNMTAVTKLVGHAILIFLFIIAVLTLVAWFNF